VKRWAVCFVWFALVAGLGCGRSSVPATEAKGEAPKEYAPEADITGVYTPEYQPKSTVHITRDGEVYTIRWEHPFGAWLGVGLRDRDKLSVGWHRVDGQDLGVSIYQIEQGGQGPKLVSKFAGYRDNRVQQETLRFLKKAD
jgi:hypothetical protein